MDFNRFSIAVVKSVSIPTSHSKECKTWERGEGNFYQLLTGVSAITKHQRLLTFAVLDDQIVGGLDLLCFLLGHLHHRFR